MSGPRSLYGTIAREALGPDAPARDVYRAAAMARNHASAVAEGRVPGRIGRPIVSNHPRGKYWREWARKRRQSACGKNRTNQQAANA